MHRALLSVVLFLSLLFSALATALLLTLTVSLAWAGQPDIPPNAAQAELATPVVCPPPSQQPVPVEVTLTTTGNPVLVSAAIQAFWLITRTAISIAAVVTVDGQSIERSRLDGSGNAVVLTPTRLVDVPAGPHTFGLSVLCFSAEGNTQIYNAWLLAYELPSALPGVRP
jgi:hypothetical protein